ncbi:MAG: Lon protease family protein [Caldilineaceae bacterium]|nr:Lon protease family protein [Caldilineaceae bacterium]
MTPVPALIPVQLNTRTDPANFSFATTAELDPISGIIGQERAVAAVEFGISIRHPGYNIFALGSPGTGKHTVVRDYLTEQAADDPSPSDWCYVYNFDEPHRPTALELPVGRGSELRAAMDELLDEIRTILPAAFETDDYRVRRQAVESTFQERQDEAFSALQAEAITKGLNLLRTPTGLIFAPVRDGEVLKAEEFQQMAQTEQDALKEAIEEMQEKLQRVVLQLPRWERELRKELQAFHDELAHFTVDPLFHELHEHYTPQSAVQRYLDAVQADIIANLPLFLRDDEGEGNKEQPFAPPVNNGDRFVRYRVNLLVDHSGRAGAPVIYEDNPAYQNLVGRVEYVPHMGGLLTDFTHIKCGSLHMANGGYLMIDALKLLSQPYAWEGLKRALRAETIRIETPGQMLSQANAISLEPEPIPLKVKVALLGDRTLYYLLSQSDPEFDELFKVMADFNDEIERTAENQTLFARLIGSMATGRKLRHLDREATARVIDQCARMAGDSGKLSMRVASVVDLLQESDYFADQTGDQTIFLAHVEQALEAQRYRAWRIPERSQESILDGTIRVQTQGEAVGQINGLSVLQLGSTAFGQPSRITARVTIGRGEVVNIEREVAMSGPSHSKGVLILASFLAARYAADFPLSLHARLVFEQSYGGVDGDSASSTELYALLSAIAGVPIRQFYAVTGSVDQFGNVQVIGGVNEKIEGFFAICQQRGLTGEQGVLIPATNVRHLMLRQEVVDAVAAGRFHIYPISHIDEGIELLTGVAAGEADGDGVYPAGTINRMVQDRLREFARRWSAFHRQNGPEFV